MASLIATYASMIAFGPNTHAYKLNIRAFWPQSLRWDCFGEKHQMGADVMAGTVLYMMLCYHRYFMIAAACAVFDVSYYGVQMGTAPGVAMVAAATML